MTDPRFPNRPDHPDYWQLSEVLVTHDAEMDTGGNFDDAVGRYIDLPSLAYAANNQAQMGMQRIGAAGKVVWDSRTVRMLMASTFISSFLAGMKYQIRKEVDHQAAQLPWIVDHFEPGVLPGEQVARFATEEDAAAFLEIIARRDPAAVTRGDYGISGPDGN